MVPATRISSAQSFMLHYVRLVHLTGTTPADDRQATRDTRLTTDAPPAATAAPSVDKLTTRGIDSRTESPPAATTEGKNSNRLSRKW